MNKIVIKGRVQPRHDMVVVTKKKQLNEDEGKNEDDKKNNILYNITEHD